MTEIETTDLVAVAPVKSETATDKNQGGLRHCAKLDWNSPNRGKLTGWAAICQDRHVRGVSRKQRRLKRQAAGA
jgi:hypothetical protein